MMRSRRRKAMSFLSLSPRNQERDDTLTDGTTNSERERERERKEMLLAAMHRYALSDTSLFFLHRLTFVSNQSFE